MNSAANSKLLKFFTNPYKIAGALDWKKMSGSIATLDIGREFISVAVASHPSIGEPIRRLKPVEMKIETKAAPQRRVLADEVVDKIQDIVKQHNVCGFVVSWPVQKEGRNGAPCGRVLHALDSIAEGSDSILSPGRQFCIWDGNHVQQQDDEWGRNPIYGEPSTKTVHIASVEQYEHKTSSTTAADIWTDFCKSHWPDLYQQEGYDDDESDLYMVEAALCDDDFVEDSGSYIGAAAY